MNSKVYLIVLYTIILMTSCSKGSNNTIDLDYLNGSELTDDSQKPEKCNREDASTGDTYEITIVNGSAFIVGGSILIKMSHDLYSFGQAKEVFLYRNDDEVQKYGNWINFPSNERSFVIPDVYPSSCYNIRVTKEGSSVSDSDDEVYISELFEIID